MKKFITKHVDNRKPQVKIFRSSVEKVEKITEVKETQKTETPNTDEKKKVNEVMTTNEKIAMAQSVLNDTSNTKRIKRDKGLIERTESSKTILTEDNKELLND